MTNNIEIVSSPNTRQFNILLNGYEGPIDLLLDLARKQKVDLSEISILSLAEQYLEFITKYNDWGAWIVFTAGITPFPYKVITIASGLTRLDLTIFVIASTLSRGLRFFIVAALLYRFGEPIRTFIEGNLGKFALLFVLSLFAGFVLIKWLM